MHILTTFQFIGSEEDFLAQANSDISHLCGDIILHWKRFLDTVNGNPAIVRYLAKVHHFYRVGIYHMHCTVTVWLSFFVSTIAHDTTM